MGAEPYHEYIIFASQIKGHINAEAKQLLEHLNQGHDVVYGTPMSVSHSLFRNITSSLIKGILQKLMGKDIAKNISTFRAFQTSIRNAFCNYIIAILFCLMSC